MKNGSEEKGSFKKPLVLVTSLFFLWGLAHNLNLILIPHLKRACQLTDFQSGWIDSAFYLGYFLMALPAGLFMKKYGYQSGILLGLITFAAGAFLFYPAAATRLYPLFLLALFIIASGLTFLETAANPYVLVLGPPATASRRLNLAQAFNGLAATLAPLLGGLVILSGGRGTHGLPAATTPQALDRYLSLEARTVQLPYLVIGLVVLAGAFLLRRIHLPEIREETTEAHTHTSLWKQPYLVLGVVAQFLYVGAKIGVTGFFIRFLTRTAGMEEQTAAYFLSLALLGFMAGRFVGAFLLRYVAPERLLALYSLMVVLLLGVATGSGGRVALAALMGSEFFMSIMFPTIFSLSVRGLGNQTKLGASLLVMAVAGGAVVPALMGYVSDRSDIYTAYLVPLGCFTGVFAYACLVIVRPWKQPAPGTLPRSRAKHDSNAFSDMGR